MITKLPCGAFGLANLSILILVFGALFMPSEHALAQELNRDPYFTPTAAKSYMPRVNTCLVLKRFFGTDYRGIVKYLHDMPELCRAMRLTRIPHYTTLRKASRRLLLFASVRELLLASVQMNSRSCKRIEYAAADSSGFESGRITSSAPIRAWVIN